MNNMIWQMMMAILHSK